MMNTRNLVLLILAVLVVVGGIFYFIWWQDNAPSKLEAFAKCLSDKGAKMYGAFWCPHCQAQKGMFGTAKKYLPYVECSTPDTNGELQVCKDQNVTEYPTWKFPDGTTHAGEMTLQELAEKSGCQLPQ
jgi:hypothetical protein